jgi:CubicO group peptidase (beta-lactamase class C family)
MFLCGMRRRRATCRLFLILVLLPVFAHADGLDVELRKEMQQEGVPGLTLAVVRNGEIVRLGAYGLGNLEWQVPATNDTRFEVASVSKMVRDASGKVAYIESTN